jgi:hypothetical protein
MLVFAEYRAYVGPPTLHRGEHVFDIRSPHAEDVTNAQLHEAIGDEISGDHVRSSRTPCLPAEGFDGALLSHTAPGFGPAR